MNKIDEFKICTTAYETFEILCLTETHINKTILDSEIEVTGFKFSGETEILISIMREIFLCLSIVELI